MAHSSSASSNQHARPTNNQNKYKGGQSKGRNHGKQQYKRPPHEEGHYATNCKIRYIKSEANFVETLTNCTINNDTTDWYTDI
jgi:hypothetical protein